MDSKNLIREMVKLQVLAIRWVERNTTLRCDTFRDMDRFLKGGKLTITYEEAINVLKQNIEKYCKSEYLLNSINDLYEKVKSSDISKLRFGVEPQKKFNELEKELDSEVIKRTLYMTNEMVGIKYIVENLFDENVKLTESAVKQACQQERLLNTKKIGKNWMVHIPECRSYWGIPDTDDRHLYKDWEY